MYFIELQHNRTREISPEVTWESECDLNGVCAGKRATVSGIKRTGYIENARGEAVGKGLSVLRVVTRTVVTRGYCSVASAGGRCGSAQQHS